MIFLLGVPILVAGNYALVRLESWLGGWHGIAITMLLGIGWNGMWLRYMISRR